jgi:superfamily II DNA/RNA helicase
VNAAALHGGKSQPQRTRTLDGFKTGTVTTLVATSLAARGIHVDDVDLVVNVDPPGDAKDYLHRGGRTARAGRTGTVVTLVLPEQDRETNRLLAAAGVKARSVRVRPGDAELVRITGARSPSGVPVAPAVAADTQRRAPRTPAARVPSGRSTQNRSTRGRTIEGRSTQGRSIEGRSTQGRGRHY